MKFAFLIVPREQEAYVYISYIAICEFDFL